jgi:hypothetical protein
MSARTRPSITHVPKFARDSPLEGTGFELPVRGRGQSRCRPFYAAESSGRVGAPSQFSDSTTPCIKAAWTRPPRPQSVPATHSAEFKRSPCEIDRARVLEVRIQSPPAESRANFRFLSVARSAGHCQVGRMGRTMAGCGA